MSEHHLTDTPLAALHLPQVLIDGIRDAGFTYCTPIQAETLPLMLSGKDVAGQAQTGTGKSAAFLLATFNHLLIHPVDPKRRPNQPRAVILAPTRELAIQIHRDAEVLGKYTGYELALIYGGTGYESQRKRLEAGVDLLIGTPGRVIDYFKQGVFDLKAVQVMVLDEADRMFDLGFIKDIRYLLRRMPPPDKRLNMLFSATLSFRVSELAYEHMNNPAQVVITPDKKTANKVAQRLYHTANEEKIALLVGLLRHMDPTRSLVFTNTKGAAERLQAWLEGNGFHAGVLSGDVPQPKRQSLLKAFSEGALPILVATDVAARGLHIPDVSHVINFDLPQDPEDYVHRIGRTARAGASGDAISFACEHYAYSLMEIEEFVGHKIPVGRVSSDLLPQLDPPVRRPPRSREGARRAPGGPRGSPSRCASPPTASGRRTSCPTSRRACSRSTGPSTRAARSRRRRRSG